MEPMFLQWWFGFDGCLLPFFLFRNIWPHVPRLHFQDLDDPLKRVIQGCSLLLTINHRNVSLMLLLLVIYRGQPSFDTITNHE